MPERNLPMSFSKAIVQIRIVVARMLANEHGMNGKMVQGRLHTVVFAQAWASPLFWLYEQLQEMAAHLSY